MHKLFLLILNLFLAYFVSAEPQRGTLTAAPPPPNKIDPVHAQILPKAGPEAMQPSIQILGAPPSSADIPLPINSPNADDRVKQLFAAIVRGKLKGTVGEQLKSTGLTQEQIVEVDTNIVNQVVECMFSSMQTYPDEDFQELKDGFFATVNDEAFKSIIEEIQESVINQKPEMEDIAEQTPEQIMQTEYAEVCASAAAQEYGVSISLKQLLGGGE